MNEQTKAASERSLCIWRLLDGKPGHESQTLGLARAMQRMVAERGQVATVVDISVHAHRLSLWDFVSRRFPPGMDRPSPDFILGAGHRTHWPMLCARRAFGGKAIALMSPSLPLSWFDRVIIPEHDNRTGRNVIVTRGVLNAMRPGEKQPGKTLVLVGGKSKHFVWDDDAVLAQLRGLAQHYRTLCVTDSRRTPESLRVELKSYFADRYMPWEHCPMGWLASELAIAENAWVTEDSVSMIYEALTAGCIVGLLRLERSRGASRRLVRGIDSLIARNAVQRTGSAHCADAILHKPPFLNEAKRVAAVIIEIGNV